MLAAVYHGPNDLRVEDVPVPKIGKGELLIKVMSASICGTDLRIFHGNHRMYAPGTVRIPGHEVVGTIAEAGAEVSECFAPQIQDAATVSNVSRATTTCAPTTTPSA